MGRLEITHQCRRHASEHRRPAGEKEQRQNDQRKGAQQRPSRGIEQHERGGLLGRTRRRRRLRLRMRRGAHVAGGIAQGVEAIHELRNGPNLLLDEFQGMRGFRKPMLRRFVQHVGYARHYPQQNEHEQHGARAAGYVQPVQHFHGTGEHEGEQTGERDRDEGDVGKIQQQSDRARNQNPDSRDLGLLATVPGRGVGQQAVLFF